MAIKVSQAFQRTSPNAIDESLTLTKAQMLTVNDNLMPAYYFTICQDDGEIYLYDKTASPSVTTGKFTKFEGGGGGGGTEGVVITKTLLASDWDANNRQSLTFNGYSADMGGVIGMPTNATAAQKEAYSEALIDVYSQSGNVFTFECENKPSIDLPVTLYAGGSGGSGSGVPAGGTTGQVLAKKSSTDGDVEWKDTSNSIFEINYSNNAIDATVAQLNAAYSAGKILKLIDNDDSDRVYTFIGKIGDPYWFITLYLNPSNALYVSHITLYLAAPGATNWTVQRQINVPIEDVQKTEMPTAASTYVDKIYQYIGTTDANYTHGLFYTCVNNSGTYSWVPVDVQTAPGLNSDSIQDIISSADLSNYAVTNGNTYSTSEQIIGRWIDGKPIYQKIVDCGSDLANASTKTSKNISHGISNIDFWISTKGIWYLTTAHSTGGTIPYSDDEWIVNINGRSANIVLTYKGDWRNTQVYAILQYTKTTD